MKKIIILVLLFTVVAGKVLSQIDVTLKGYPLVTTGWNIGGYATVVDSEVRLCTAAGGEDGYVYYDSVMSLTACGQFTVKYDYLINTADGVGISVADGIAFFYISDPPSGFVTGGGLGLPDLLTGMVFTLDTYDNDGDGLNPESQIFGYSSSSTYLEANRSQMIGPINPHLNFMDDGTWHHIEIDYNAGNISVYYDYSTVPGMTGYYLVTIPAGYFGFSSATGAGWSVQYVKNLSIYAVGAVPPPKVLSPVVYCQYATADTLVDTAIPGNPVYWFTTDTATVVSLPGSPTPNTSVPGTTIYYVRQGTGTCISEPDSVEVIVNPQPTTLPGSNSPVCAGDTLFFTASDTVTSDSVTYSWSGPNSFTSALQNPYISSVSTLAAGTYSVVMSVNGCASPVAATDVVVNTPPVISGVTNSGPACVGASLSLSCTATAGVSYSWTGPGFIVPDTSSAPVIDTTAVSDSGTYTLIVSDSGCSSLPMSTGVVIYALPAAPSASSNSPVCSGSTLLLSATDTTAGVSYSWAGPASFVSTLQNPSISAVLMESNGIYSVTATSVEGCNSPPGTVYVIVDSTPAITIVTYSNPATCLGSDGTITLGGLIYGTTYSINYEKGTASFAATLPADSLGEVVITGLSSGNYSNITAYTGSCLSNAAGPVTLHNPAIPVITAISNSGPVCAGSGVSFSCITGAGVSYSWTGPGFIVPDTLSNPVIDSTTVSDSGTYTLTVSDSGCTSLPMSTDVVIYALPATPIASSNSPVCSDSTLLLSATDTTAGVSYSWTGPRSFVSTLQSPSISVVPMAGNGVYSAKATSVKGCSSLPGTINVVVDSTPFITIVTYTNPGTCSASDGSITLGGLISGTTYSVNYEKGTTSFTATLTANTSGEVVITGLPSDYYSDITATSESCPSNSVGPVTLHDPGMPVITSISNSGPVCAGSGISLSCTSTSAGATYSWTGPSFTSKFQNPVIAVTTLSDTGDYTVTATDSGCTSLPVSTDVVLYALPATPIAVSNSPVCADSTLIFSANDATPGVTYTWSGPSGFTSTGATPVLSGVTAGNAGNYYVVASNSICASNPDSTFVIITPSPVIAIESYTNPTTCLGGDGTITLNGAEAGTTYEVDYLSGASPVSVVLTANDSGQLILTGLSSGDYTDIQISAGSCPSNVVGPLTLHDPAAPAIPAISDNSPVCAGSALLFKSGDTASGISFSWTGPGFIVPDTMSNPFIDTATIGVTGVYTLTVTKNNCYSANSISAVVNVLPPVPSMHSNSPVCAGSTLTLSAGSSTGATYNWQGPSGFGLITPDTVITISGAEASAIGTYTVWATLDGCPSPTDTIEVSVIPLPAVPTVVDTFYCQYNSPVALVATGSNLLWYTTSSGSSGTSSAPVPSTLTPGELTWYVSQNVAGCESPRATQTVLIIPQPAPPVVTPDTLCQSPGGTAMPEVTGDSLLWYSGVGGGTDTMQVVSLDFVQQFTWAVTQTVDGCTSNPATAAITVNATPAIPVATNNFVCSGSTLLLSATDDMPGVSYSWNGPGGFTSTAIAPSIANAQVSQSGAYLVTATLNGCTSPADTIMVTIYSTPVFSIVASKPYVCQNDTLTLAYSGPSFTTGGDYTWYFPFEDKYISGIGPEVLRFTAPWNNEVYLTVSDTSVSPCWSKDSLNIAVMPAPTGFIYIKPDICVGEVADVSLLNIEGEIVNYNWNYAPATAVSTPANPWDPQSLVWNAPGTYAVTLTVTTNMQCPSAVISDTVNIIPLPEAAISPISATMPVCEDDSVLFSPSVYVSGSQYLWSPSPFFNNNNAESTYGTIAFTGYVTLTVTNEWGCTATDSVLITTQPCCQLAMPNAFMPGKTGSVNAVYRPVTTRTFMVHEFRIANRWGQTVFETDNIANGWDGTFNGVPQDVGVYFYYLRYDCEGKTIEKSGDVTLVR